MEAAWLAAKDFTLTTMILKEEMESVGFWESRPV